MFFVLEGVMTVQVGSQLQELAAPGASPGAHGASRTPLPIALRARCAS